MFTSMRVPGLVLLVAMAPLTVVCAQATRATQPLAEDQIIRLVDKLKIKGEVVASMVQKQGLAFTADDTAIERLKAAGAPDVVLDAVRTAGAAKPASAPEKPVTYQDVVDLLNLGVPEQGIIERLKQSPTTFTLSKEQVEELKRLGGTEKLTEVMGAVRTSLDSASEINNLAIAFDCSGSMSERTPEGRTKMEAARESAIRLVQEVPDGVRLAFIIYGHDRAQECNAVRVVRPLSPLDRKGKDELVRLIGGLQPVGSTPIALALRTAGQELEKAQAPSGLVLISDGKEMCGGNPTSEASALSQRLKLDFGVQVVGFGVKPDERQALEEIARAGKGKYYDAPTPAALRDVVQMLAKVIKEEAKPAPEGTRVTLKRRGQARNVTVQRPAIQLPPLGVIYLTETGSNSAHAADYHAVAKCAAYDQKMRIPPVNKEEKFDLWWVPKDKASMAVKMAADLAVSLDQDEVVVKPEEHLGLVRLVGKDLPATKQVFLGPPNYGQEVAGVIGPHKLQKAARYGQDLVIPAGTYNLWIDPVDENKPEVVAEKIEVKAGKMTVIE
jgi:hypothetical protein